MKQAQSVLNATIEVLGDDFQPGTPVLSYITKPQIEAIVDAVTQSIMSGETDFSDEARTKYDTEAKVRTYTKGMVNNWHRKHKELNGGAAYQAKNPGSRAGSSDPVVRELRKLKAQLEAAGESTAEVQAEIDSRVQQAQASKAKSTPTVDAQKLPEALRHLVKKAS